MRIAPLIPPLPIIALLRPQQRKADSTTGDLQRQVERLKDKVSQLSSKAPSFSEQVSGAAGTLHTKISAHPQYHTRSKYTRNNPPPQKKVARLESEIRMVKKENGRLADETKAVTNQLRAKDRELGVAQGKLAWAAQVGRVCVDVEACGGACVVLSA